MELDELLKQRRSTRSYKKAEVLKQDIDEIVKASLFAPSWRNSETGRYYVALSKQAKQVVYDALPGFNQLASKNAAYIIACYKKGEAGANSEGEFVDKLKNSWGAYDLGLQNSYLILKASELGYDTLIMGLRDEEALRKYFKIAKDEIMMPVIAIGKKKKEPKLAKRKDLDEVLKVF